MSLCPSCRKAVPSRAEGAEVPFFPFCSERCKAVDLGRWFGGAYRVPAEPVSPDELPTRSAEDDEVDPPRTAGDHGAARRSPPPRRRS